MGAREKTFTANIIPALRELLLHPKLESAEAPVEPNEYKWKVIIVRKEGYLVVEVQKLNIEEIAIGTMRSVKFELVNTHQQSIVEPVIGTQLELTASIIDEILHGIRSRSFYITVLDVHDYEELT